MGRERMFTPRLDADSVLNQFVLLAANASPWKLPNPCAIKADGLILRLPRSWGECGCKSRSAIFSGASRQSGAGAIPA